MGRIETILSTDCETDGRLPGRHSMRQLGSVAFNMKGQELSKFIANLKPLKGAQTDTSTMKFWKEQPKEAWQRVIQNPQDPKFICQEFMRWMAQFPKPILYFAPVMYDGMWVRWYMEYFIGWQSMWHRALDLRSVFWTPTGQFSGDVHEYIRKLTGARIENPTPHYALTDAREQGQLLFAFIKWLEEHKMRIPV